MSAFGRLKLMYQTIIRIYSVPENAFDAEEEDEE